ncbi:hypothetical protein BD626DRAFT_461923 [Schizophyllum amplum]|uniref:NAD(P)-binding protein n=1 Tax=Schizophyllum amplum TaxID=97359 RepID=A0A550C4X7_9AGAR|nr:hypothetical protein BD626DRAFT_461923 [Auriculariopsis ampla]
MSASPLVWVITGTSTGLGRELAKAALARGDKVIATARARSVSKLDDLKADGADVIELDVTAPLDTLKAAAEKAVAIHNRIDVVVNNAGYILVGAIEENTPQETFDQFNTNVFGALNVTRAFLPYMRQRKTGTVVFLGSLGGWRGGPNAGLYCSTKWALRGINESLHAEISPLGLRSVCFDFGYFRTSFLTPDHRSLYESRIEDYREMTERANQALLNYDEKQPGDPKKGVSIMLDVVRGEGIASGRPWEINVQLGSDCFDVVKEHCEKALARLAVWEGVTKSTDITE